MTGIGLTQQIRNQPEPISSYVASLRILANKCEFGTLTDELIRDRIVCGIHSDRVRKHLLYESKLTLESAVTICKSNEQSEQNQKLLNKESDVHALHKTYKPAHKYSKHHGKQASKSEVTNQIKTQYILCVALGEYGRAIIHSQSSLTYDMAANYVVNKLLAFRIF